MKRRNGREVAVEEVKVHVARAISYAERFPPNVIKIDVEGFELEVLTGMAQFLASPTLRSLFIEVHFSILSERGRTEAPRKIVHRFRLTGFNVKWLDPSHLVAQRRDINFVAAPRAERP